MEHWCVCEDNTCLGCSIDKLVEQYGKTKETEKIIKLRYGLLGLDFYKKKYLNINGKV